MCFIVPLIFIISSGLTYLIYKVCFKYNVLDIPNQRSSHNAPKALMGGGAIVVSTTLALTGLYLLTDLSRQILLPAWTLIIVLICAIGIAAAGLIDDIYKLSPALRFSLQIILSGITCTVLFYVINRPFSWLTGLLIAAGIIWLAGNINIYNFMDGIDGIAGGCGIIFAIFFAIIGYKENMPEVYITAVVLVPAIAGFLIWNYPPAKIFMGDVGSTFLGYTFAVLTLMLFLKNPVHIFSGAAILTPFLFDGTITIIRRALRGEKVWQAHREHLYQRLVKAGWSHRRTSLLYWVLSAITGLIAVVVSTQWLLTMS